MPDSNENTTTGGTMPTDKEHAWGLLLAAADNLLAAEAMLRRAGLPIMAEQAAHYRYEIERAAGRISPTPNGDAA